LPGDAGTATLIEAEAVESTFSLNSDGARAESLIVRGGGFRHPASPNSLMDVTYEDGSVRNAHQLEMNGLEVFNFTVREVSKDIARVLEEQGLTEQDVDYFLFHQANAFILNFILKKRKIPKEKVPASLTHYGNTVCASIPLTWVTACGGKKMDGTKLLLCGYGGGLSWGTALLDVEGCCVGELIVADDL
jgi:3-oxoacyl-[acyl-carrier-protein] synthase-3